MPLGHFAKRIVLSGMIAVLVIPAIGRGQTIWSSGPNDITFTKAAGANPTLAANQDRITSMDWITRGTTQGIYNAELESGFSSTSPADTQWAFSGQEGNPTFSYGQGAAEFSSLTLTSWEASLGGSGQVGNVIVGDPGVLHLISFNIYIDIEFTAWGVGDGGGGSFTYIRATEPEPMPEPTSLGLLSVGGATLLLRRAWGRRLAAIWKHNKPATAGGV